MSDVRASAHDGPVAERLEQGTHNSTKGFCARFHSVAQRCGRWVCRQSHICSALHRIAHFCSKICSTVEKTVKNLTAAARARVELFLARICLHARYASNFAGTAIALLLFARVEVFLA